MSSGSTNYAKLFGFHSIGAAVVFAILYLPLAGWFFILSARYRTRTLIFLTIFCLIRVTAFIIRALMASSGSAGSNLNLFIGDEVLFSVGFFGLLFSAYTIVLDRENLSDNLPPQGIVNRILRNERLFRLILLVAVIMGVVGITESTGNSSANSAHAGETLRKVSVVVFLVLTILQAYQTVILAIEESSSVHQQVTHESLGGRYGSYLLLCISVLLLVREAFLTATISTSSSSKQNEEKFWYPLVALPELLVAMFFAIPGLVPTSGRNEKPHVNYQLPR